MLVLQILSKSVIDNSGSIIDDSRSVIDDSWVLLLGVASFTSVIFLLHRPQVWKGVVGQPEPLIKSQVHI
jgi:hypothetical protein